MVDLVPVDLLRPPPRRQREHSVHGFDGESVATPLLLSWIFSCETVHPLSDEIDRSWRPVAKIQRVDHMLDQPLRRVSFLMPDGTKSVLEPRHLPFFARTEEQGFDLKAFVWHRFSCQLDWDFEHP